MQRVNRTSRELRCESLEDRQLMTTTGALEPLISPPVYAAAEQQSAAWPRTLQGTNTPQQALASPANLNRRSATFGQNVDQQETRWRGVFLHYGAVDGTYSAQDLATLARCLKAENVNLLRWGLMWDSTYAEVSKGRTDAEKIDISLSWLRKSAVPALDGFLAECREVGNNVRVIIDIHNEPGGSDDQDGDGHADVSPFRAKWARQALKQSWEYLASHYAGNSQIAAYDLLNEPSPGAGPGRLIDWNELAQDLVRVIRKCDAKRAIIIEPLRGDLRELDRLPLIRDSNVVYSIHVYHPTRYSSGKTPLVDPPDKHELESYLAPVVEFQKRVRAQGLNSTIYVGEFGVSREAKDPQKYIKRLISVFEERGWQWTYMTVGTLGCMDDEGAERARVLRAAFAKNAVSPIESLSALRLTDTAQTLRSVSARPQRSNGEERASQIDRYFPVAEDTQLGTMRIVPTAESPAAADGCDRDLETMLDDIAPDISQEWEHLPQRRFRRGVR